MSGSARYGDITSFRIGPPLLGIHAHLLRHPNMIKHVLVEQHANYVKGVSNDHMLPILGQGPLTAEGQLWAEQRKRLQPLFREQALLERVDTINRCIDRLTTRWERLASKDPGTDIAVDLMRLTLEIAAEVLFEFDISSESPEVSAALDDLETDVMRRVRNPLAAPRWMPTRRNRACRRAQVTMLELVARIIDHVRGQPAGSGGLMEGMIRAGGGELGYPHLQHQVMTLLLASHETTASALTWTWYLLSQNPAAEDQLHGEVDRVLAGRPPGAADLDELEFTRQCVLESLRLFPPGWCIERRAVADDLIAGHLVKRGDMVLLSTFVAHRNPEYWTDPERFEPSRFAGDRERDLPRFVFFPFGGGPRRCIGAEFALLQAKLILSRIASRWQLRLVEGHPVELDPQVTLRAKYGMRMHVTRR